ncbi:MAG: hypothetical protein AcusKO_48610 [Acuticoccus sp.]
MTTRHWPALVISLATMLGVLALPASALAAAPGAVGAAAIGAGAEPAASPARYAARRSYRYRRAPRGYRRYRRLPPRAYRPYRAPVRRAWRRRAVPYYGYAYRPLRACAPRVVTVRRRGRLVRVRTRCAPYAYGPVWSAGVLRY